MEINTIDRKLKVRIERRLVFVEKKKMVIAVSSNEDIYLIGFIST